MFKPTFSLSYPQVNRDLNSLQRRALQMLFTLFTPLIMMTSYIDEYQHRVFSKPITYIFLND